MKEKDSNQIETQMLDVTRENYLEKYYMAKHKRTFDRIRKDLQTKLKSLGEDREVEKIWVRPLIEIWLKK